MRKIIPTIILYLICHSVSAQMSENREKKADDVLRSKAEEISMVPPLLPCACEDRSLVDLSPSMPPVQQQGSYNDCVGWALGYACRSYYHKLYSHVDFFKNGSMIDSSNLVSPYFIYNSLRTDPTRGINLKKAMDFMQSNGSCTWDMLDSVAKCTRPTEAQKSEALAKRLQFYKYYRLGYKADSIPLNEIRNALKCGNPVVVAVSDDIDYFTAAYHGPSYALWTSISASEYGSHAVVIVGYDDAKRQLKFMNSYGASWADQGYGYISYDIAETVIIEAYVLKPQPPVYRVAIHRMGATMDDAPTSYRPTRAEDISIGDLVPDDAQLKVDSLDGNGVGLSVSLNGGSGNQSTFLNDPSTSVFIRFFAVETDGRVRPLISKDGANRLGNGQTAFKSVLKIDPNTGAYIFSADIAYQKLNVHGETGKKEIHSEQHGSTKMRADAVFYQDQEPVAVSKPVDFEARY